MKATLGLFDATAISVGAIVGAGIYVVIGITAGLAGPAMVLSMVIAAAISLVTALSFAELSAWLPREGGVYAFAHELLSPFVGFSTGWMWVVSNTFTGSAVSLGFAYYFTAIVPGLNPAWLAAGLCLLFTLLNYLGVKHSANVNNFLVVSKLLILAFFIVLGVTHMHPSNFTPFVKSGSGVLYGSIYIFFAFGGFARVAVVAEEVKDPRRNVPRAIVLSLVISTVFYILVGLTAVGLISASALGNSSSPLADAAMSTGATWTGYVISLGGLLATASVLLTSVLGVSRVSYAMARNRELPSALALVHKSYGTPYYSVWIAGTLMAVFVLFLSLDKVVAVSTFAQLFYYGAANAAALRLKPADARYPRAVPVAGLAACIVLLAFVLFASPQGWAIGVLSFAVGTGIFVAGRKIKSRQA
jgi:APA family basic amino acid/polyamine antiporter